MKLAEVFLFEEDSDEELPRHHKFTQHHHGKRYHAHRCREIEVAFKYVDQHVSHAFRPGATIRKLVKWAKDHFKVDQKEKFDVQLRTDSEPLPLDAQIGSYVGHDTCKVSLYLVPSCRING